MFMPFDRTRQPTARHNTFSAPRQPDWPLMERTAPAAPQPASREDSDYRQQADGAP
ncbi:hypothetical protein [Gemmatimonas aurantiaca]|uniref:hypothetical protein n=1 Tax=Gemmatimonas aurantiaca TaxID=173480 RepID=UPI00301C1521